MIKTKYIAGNLNFKATFKDQPSPLMCVPMCLKIILDEAKKLKLISKTYSLKKCAKVLKYNQWGGTSFLASHKEINEFFKKEKISLIANSGYGQISRTKLYEELHLINLPIIMLFTPKFLEDVLKRKIANEEVDMLHAVVLVYLNTTNNKFIIFDPKTCKTYELSYAQLSGYLSWTAFTPKIEEIRNNSRIFFKRKSIKRKKTISDYNKNKEEERDETISNR